MAPHIDILDQRDSLWRPGIGSIALHVAVAAGLLLGNVVGHRQVQPWGDPLGGGPGSVAVNVVSRIPLPARSGPVNPVARDTESAVPTPPPKSKAAQKAKAPEPDAIPIPSRNAKQRAAQAASAMDKWRAKQQYQSNQLYSPAGQVANTPMYGVAGGGGVNVGQATSPFGSRFGWYAEILRGTLARNWNKGDIDSRLKNPPSVVVAFTILKNGTVPANSVRVIQRSGNTALDYSAMRAIYDSSPFPALPAGFERNEALIEFEFELRR